LRGIYAYGLSSYNVICMLKFENWI
jgi:hypothetical protein